MLCQTYAVLSRVYAALEANGKVNGIGKISHPSLSQTLGPIWMRLPYITISPLGGDVQNLVKIDLAVAALRMRETNAVSCGFFCLHIRLSIRCSPRLQATF